MAATAAPPWKGHELYKGRLQVTVGLQLVSLIQRLAVATGQAAKAQAGTGQVDYDFAESLKTFWDEYSAQFYEAKDKEPPKLVSPTRFPHILEEIRAEVVNAENVAGIRSATPEPRAAASRTPSVAVIEQASTPSTLRKRPLEEMIEDSVPTPSSKEPRSSSTSSCGIPYSLPALPAGMYIPFSRMRPSRHASFASLEVSTRPSNFLGRYGTLHGKEHCSWLRDYPASCFLRSYGFSSLSVARAVARTAPLAVRSPGLILVLRSYGSLQLMRGMLCNASLFRVLSHMDDI